MAKTQRALGKLEWLVPDCYWPEQTDPTAPYPSHESICVLNTGDSDASLSLMFYFEDREPVSARAQCAARRTHHIRLDRLETDGGALPQGVPYAALLSSDVPVVVQYSRCDASHPAVTLMTSVAYPIE